MRKKLLVFTLMLTATAALAVPQSPRMVLTRALDNEREAIARYAVFADKAEAEGYHGAAQLFRAALEAEKVHAQRITAAMEKRGIPVPEPRQYQPSAGSTQDNLRSAGAAEMAERDGIYRDAIDAAISAKDDELAKMFDQTRDTEVEHANLCLAAARNLESMKTAHRYFVCHDCGYTSEIDIGMCVLCRVKSHPHEID